VRRVRRLAGALLVAGGLLAVADAGLTVAWQEPVGALRASAAQDDLGARYAALTAGYAATRRVSVRTTMLERARTARRLDAATAEGEPLGRLRIRRLGLDVVWVQGTASRSLREAPGTTRARPCPAAAGPSGSRGTAAPTGRRSGTSTASTPAT
jgi:hypothetical protein